MQDSEIDSAQETDNNNGVAVATEKRLNFQKIYLKDISYEAPGTPQIFTAEWLPKAEQQFASTNTQLSEFVYEVSLRVTVTVKVGDKVAYLAEVNQAGIFEFVGYDSEELRPLLGVYCPTILFPYVREAISELSVRGGYPSLLLQHVDFATMYNNFLQQKTNTQADADDGAAVLQ